MGQENTIKILVNYYEFTIKKIKAWCFLRKINKEIIPLGARAHFYSEDVLQISMGEDFTHITIKAFNNNKYFIKHIKEQVRRKI